MATSGSGDAGVELSKQPEEELEPEEGAARHRRLVGRHRVRMV
jgi:hypothetical protein